MNTSNFTKNFLHQNITSNNECSCNTQQECKLDDMVLCDFNIRPKLKYKHICNLINERHVVPLTMRRLLQICKKLGLRRQRNIDDGTSYCKNQFMNAFIYIPLTVMPYV